MDEPIKNKKPISHFDRLHNMSNSHCYVPIDRLENKRLVTKTEYDENLKRMVQRSEFQTIDRHEEMKNYRTFDFALENLMAVGKELSPVSIEPSRFDVLDNLPY